MLWRARKDNLEQRSGCKRSEQVPTRCANTGSVAIDDRILGSRGCGRGIYVNGNDAGCAGACCRYGKNTRPSPDIGNPSATQIESIDELSKEGTAQEIAWVKNSGTNDQPKSRQFSSGECCVGRESNDKKENESRIGEGDAYAGWMSCADLERK